MTIDWNIATDGEIVKAMKQAVAKMRLQAGYEPTHCNTLFGWFALRPAIHFMKIKKGPGKYRTIAVHFTRVK